VLRCHPFGTHGFDPVPEVGVPRHDPMFWRYRRFGACPGGGTEERDGGGDGAGTGLEKE